MHIDPAPLFPFLPRFELAKWPEAQTSDDSKGNPFTFITSGTPRNEEQQRSLKRSHGCRLTEDVSRARELVYIMMRSDARGLGSLLTPKQMKMNNGEAGEFINYTQAGGWQTEKELSLWTHLYMRHPVLWK